MPRRTYWQEYLAALQPHWVASVSGGTAFIISVVALGLDSNKFAFWGLLLLGVFGMGKGAYGAWKDERLKYEDIVRKNSLPAILGQFKAIRFFRPAYADPTKVGTFIGLDLRVWNESPTDGNLKGATVYFSEKNNTTHTHEWTGLCMTVFKKGVGILFSEDIRIDGIEPTAFNPRSVQLRLTDYYDQEVFVRSDNVTPSVGTPSDAVVNPSIDKDGSPQISIELVLTCINESKRASAWLGGPRLLSIQKGLR